MTSVGSTTTSSKDMAAYQRSYQTINTLHSDTSFYDSSKYRDSILEKNIDKRKEHTTSDFETLIHLLKCNIGTGILALPLATKNAGFIIGPLGILIIGIIATHCMIMLVQSSGQLCLRYDIPALDYSETMMFAVKERFSKPRLATFTKYAVNVFLMITQFGFCSVYLVFVGDTIQHVMNEVYCVNLDHRAWMAIATIPLVFFSWIKNLDHLASLSALANICIICGLAIIIYDEIYLFATGSAAVMSQHLNLTDTSAATSHQLNLIGTPQGTALFFGNALFSYEAIGIVLPLENKMTNPHHAQGVIYFGMTIVTFMYSSFGLLGYLTFGNSILASITLNLCADDYGAAILFLMTKILFGYSIFISYLLQFYVPMDFIEPQISNLLKLDKLEYKFPSFHKVLKTLVKCGFRTAIVFIIAGLAIGIPDLGDLLTLVGAVASSALALIFPPFIHILTFWKVRDANLICSWLPRPVWVTKDVAIMSLGMTGLVFGTYAAINNIVLFYENPAQSSSCNTTFQTYCHLLPP